MRWYRSASQFDDCSASRPFDHPEWVFELKYDGFRSLAVIQNGRCQLISRNGHPFNSFDTLRKALVAPSEGQTVFDGEIVCLDKRGRPQFNDLLFHRGEPCFFAFDLLMSDVGDLRTERLTDRKHDAATPVEGVCVQNAIRRTRRAIRHDVV
jgi:bifunctional non-homologous end joining protein LigD